MGAGTITDRSDASDIDPQLLRRPLEYLLVDHLRQRDLCTALEAMADDAALDRELARSTADQLDHLVLHGIDDEEDLYPLLRRRAEPEDRVEDVLGALSGEHAHEDRLVGTLVGALRAATEGERLDGVVRAGVRVFAARLRRRLTVENALVMPLADLRLTESDRADLARRMAARRGIALPRGSRDA